jgi:hypothetical protein
MSPDASAEVAVDPRRARIVVLLAEVRDIADLLPDPATADALSARLDELGTLLGVNT